VERFLQNQRKLITLKIRGTTNMSVLQPCFHEGLYSPIKHKRVHIHLPSSGNWEVKRGIVKITNKRNTNLAISIPWMVWKKQWCTQLLIGLNLRKHFNLACQYLYVSIKRKLFSVLREQRLNTKNKEVVFFQCPSFSTHCITQFNLSTLYMYRTKTWRVHVIKMRTNDSPQWENYFAGIMALSLSFFWNNPFYFKEHSLVRDDWYGQRVNKNLILRIKKGIWDNKTQKNVCPDGQV